MIRTIKWLSVVSTIGMIFILLGGALVTKTDSGMGCGTSWPLCNGQLIPTNITPELIIELSHRLVSGVIGVSVTMLAILTWISFKENRELKFLAFSSVFFIVLQGLIGAAAVVWGQSDFVLAIHFGVSLISFATVFILMLLIFETDRKWDTKSVFIQKNHRINIYLLTIFTLVVVYTGALVRHIDAHLVCGSWPFCNNSNPFAFADYNFHQWVQMGHRLLAGILLIWTIMMFVNVYKHYRNNRVMYIGWIITLGLIIAQVVAGAFIIFTSLNIWISLLHALFITCYFGNLSYFILLSYRSATKESNVVINRQISFSTQVKNEI